LQGWQRIKKEAAKKDDATKAGRPSFRREGGRGRFSALVLRTVHSDKPVKKIKKSRKVEGGTNRVQELQDRNSRGISWQKKRAEGRAKLAAAVENYDCLIPRPGDSPSLTKYTPGHAVESLFHQNPARHKKQGSKTQRQRSVMPENSELMRIFLNAPRRVVLPLQSSQ